MIKFLSRFEKTEYISFVINDIDLLKIYELIRNRIRKIIDKEFDYQPVYDGKHENTKLKIL